MSTKNIKNKFNITRLTALEQDVQMLIGSQLRNDALATKHTPKRTKNDKSKIKCSATNVAIRTLEYKNTTIEQKFRTVYKGNTRLSLLDSCFFSLVYIMTKENHGMKQLN